MLGRRQLPEPWRGRPRGLARPLAPLTVTRTGRGRAEPSVVPRPVPTQAMHALLVSTLVVAVAEIGDKTQLLAVLLATRFRKPVPILFGILLATATNHALAALAGQWIGTALSGPWLRWVLGLGFLAMAAWVMVPDTIEADKVARLRSGNAFLVTLCSFFLVEIGDKTQIATAALAARFDSLGLVVLGTTAGLMIADLPAVLCGHLIGHRLDPRWPRAIAALIFTTQGLLVLVGVELDFF
jgi:putative Ca2+/H+ antiporter (TMEM165/GDT1 family)